jgi:capsular polysaccharide transport system permease protein
MIGQRAALQAQLDQMQRLAPANPSIPAVRQRIAAISAQIAIAGQPGSRIQGWNCLEDGRL